MLHGLLIVLQGEVVVTPEAEDVRLFAAGAEVVGLALQGGVLVVGRSRIERSHMGADGVHHGACLFELAGGGKVLLVRLLLMSLERMHAGEAEMSFGHAERRWGGGKGRRGLAVPTVGLVKVIALGQVAEGKGGERLATGVVGGQGGGAGALKIGGGRGTIGRLRRLHPAVPGGERGGDGGVSESGGLQGRPPAAGDAHRPGDARGRLGDGKAEAASQ